MEGAGGEAPRSAPPTNWRSFHPTIFRFRRTGPSVLRTPRVMTLDEDSSAAGGGSSAAHGAQPRPPQQPPSALQLQSAQEVRSPHVEGVNEADGLSPIFQSLDGQGRFDGQSTQRVPSHAAICAAEAIPMPLSRLPLMLTP